MASRLIPFYIVTAPGQFEAEKVCLTNFMDHVNTILAKNGSGRVQVTVWEDPYCAEDCLRFFCQAEYPITMTRDGAPPQEDPSLCFSYTHMDTLFVYALLCLRTQALPQSGLRVHDGHVCLDGCPVMPLLHAEPFVHHPAMAALKQPGADRKQTDDTLDAILLFCLKDLQARMGDTYSEFRATSFSLFWKGDCSAAADVMLKHDALGRKKKDVRYQVEAHHTIAAILAIQPDDSDHGMRIKRHFRYIARYLPHVCAIQAYTEYIHFLIRFERRQEARAILDVLSIIDERPHGDLFWHMMEDYVGEVKPERLYHETATTLLRELNGNRIPSHLTLLANAYRAYLSFLQQTGEDNYVEQWRVMDHLAQTLRRQEDYAAELPIREAIYTGHCRHFGENALYTLGVMRDLAKTYLLIGDAHTCVTMLEELYARRCAAQGELHPDTLVALSMIADTYQWMNDTAKQMAWLERLYEAHCRAYGPDNEDTLAVLTTLNKLRSDNT